MSKNDLPDFCLISIFYSKRKIIYFILCVEIKIDLAGS